MNDNHPGQDSPARNAEQAADEGVDIAEIEQRTPNWHMPEIAEVLQQVESREQGLNEEEARQRLEEHGPNVLPQQPPVTIWQILLRQFQSPLIYVLLAAAGVALLAQDYKDAGFIAAVLAINALIGGYQEWRAEQSSRALQKLLNTRASVLRNGKIREIPAEEVVVGDIIALESGNRVPADLRLMSTQGLEVDESLLTGESLGVLKDSRWQGEQSATMGDRLNLAYAASIVIRGRARGVVVATSTETVVGQLAVDVMTQTGGKAPLIERMHSFANTIAYVVLGSVTLIGILGVVVQGKSLEEMFMFGIALAVSAIPEGLPAALTVALAVATTRMAQRGVIVRRQAAVEGLGSCTMIASDKTGTLTCNELTVREIDLADDTALQITGEGYRPEGKLLPRDAEDAEGESVETNDEIRALVRVGVLCNEADLHQVEEEWQWRGDPTDIALLSLGVKSGIMRKELIEEYPLVNQIPFEPENQYAASFHRQQEEILVFVKGAPEKVLSMCDWQGDESRRKHFHDSAESMAERGYRVLGMADGPTSAEESEQTSQHPQGLTFRGFVGMIDPLRPGVKEAVAHCRSAGITVCMVTGDHPVTALAISRDLGMAEDSSQVVIGSELEGKSEEDYRAAIRTGRVFARVTPRQKLELVNAARAEGHFVAVTGDGVNDAPALRAANIGVAMGKDGTDVAREAAELVISDDNFATIVNGVEEGRIAYDNIRKVINLLVANGAAEVLLITSTFFVGMLLLVEGRQDVLPFLPVQLLWLNLVTSGVQGIALAFEPGEKGVLRRRPRKPTEPIFNQLMLERLAVASITMAVTGMCLFVWMINNGFTDYEARNVMLLLFVLFENVHIGNCRSEIRSALAYSPLRSPFLLAGAVSAFVIHFIAMHVPFMQNILGTEPVSLNIWLILIPSALTVFATMELHKWTWYWRGKEG